MSVIDNRINAQIHELARLFQANRIPEARILGRSLVNAAPDNTQVLMLLGALHGRLGEFKEAESCYESLCRLEPNSFEHYCYLGLARVMQKRLDEARAPFEKMLQLRPDFAEGHMHMGCLLRDLGRHDLATGYLRRALHLSPGLHDAAVFLANILIFQGSLDEAIVLCDRVLARAPYHSEALASKALILEKQGKPDAAWRCLAPLVSANTVTPGTAIVYAKLAPKYDRVDQAMSLLNSVLSRASLAPSQRQELHFALGELNDKAGNYDAAFANYHAANSLYPYRCNVVEMQKKADQIIGIFSGDGLPAARHDPDRCPRPIFILGMPRSGTSLVEQILAAHPDVAAGGELEILPDVERRAPGIIGSDRNYPDCLRDASGDRMTALANLYLDAVSAISRGAGFITDKLPGNYERLGLIEKLFPDARIIHATRHPLDTCLSCYFQNFGNTHVYSSDLRALGEIYRIYERLMRHWREKLSIRIHDLSYEALVSEPEKTVRTLLEFCGLPWDPHCMDFHQSKRYVNTASYDQVRQPIYQRSVGRWKNYEAHLGELMTILSR